LFGTAGRKKGSPFGSPLFYVKGYVECLTAERAERAEVDKEKKKSCNWFLGALGALGG